MINSNLATKIACSIYCLAVSESGNGSYIITSEEIEKSFNIVASDTVVQQIVEELNCYDGVLDIEVYYSEKVKDVLIDINLGLAYCLQYEEIEEDK